jgi:RNA exonuclease NGL2
MQEVDKDKAGTFWTETLAKMDHKSVFLTAQGKLHGNLISYNERMFSVRDSSMIDYDQTEPDGLPKQIQSRNTGMFVALDFKLKPNTGVIVGTTHMFWHPKGSYERTRQMAIFMEEAARYATCYNWPVILAGDFNSECFDSPYLCASAKPTDIDEDARNILRESLRYPFINVQLEGDAQEEPQDVESSKKDLHGEALIELQIDKLVEHFNKVPFEAKSLYGYGNRKVHPSNVHPKGIGEPIFSNWAAKWRGLLDYIFVLHPIDSQPPEGYVSHGVRLLELLRMPEPQEMGPEPSGQPRENQYPSDHLCLMATIEFNNYP